MLLHGKFKTQKGDTVEVRIVTGGDTSDAREIGTDGIWFADDPVEINCETRDDLTHVLRHSATIRLQSEAFLSDLYCADCLDSTVTISRGSTCLFAGFIEPMKLDQPFNEVADDVELYCIDLLSALSYQRYRGIGVNGTSYKAVKQAAGQITFRSLLDTVVKAAADRLKADTGKTMATVYDGNIRISEASGPWSAFDSISIPELLFLGDAETDVWSSLDIIEEMMRYLNLRVMQEGMTLRIWHADSVKRRLSLTWHSPDGVQTHTSDTNVPLRDDNAEDCDTRISLSEVYNKVELTCDVKDMDDVVESPLGTDATASPYPQKQIYLTEYFSPGCGQLYDLANNGAQPKKWPDTDAEDKVCDVFLQVMKPEGWEFHAGRDVVITPAEGVMQHVYPDFIGGQPGALLVAMGRDMHRLEDDDSPSVKPDMTNYMVMSVLGNNKDKETEAYPTAQSLLNYAPRAVYTGNISGGAFSPADDKTTNYLVISGDIFLAPLHAITSSLWYERIPDASIMSAARSDPFTGDSKISGYYTRKWYFNGEPSRSTFDSGLIPPHNPGKQLYEYKYSAEGDGSDTISKLSVVSCMLVIGDKCVVETGDGSTPGCYKWVKFKEREECADDEEYFSQCFSIGVNPKIGDYLIGQTHPIQNNISHDLGIDAEGTAIPIRKSDKVSGKVRFAILGPYNLMWDEVTRKHPTWFRHTKWTTTTVPLMAHVSAIWMSDFEIKAYSDNALVNNTRDTDLVYVSDTVETFANVRDDITFRFTTALTTEERASLGINDSVKMSAPLDETTGNVLLSVGNVITHEAAKPEQLYVDDVWRASHKPRIILEHSITDTAALAGMFKHYTHPALPGKDFYPTAIDRNLIEGTARLTLKEIDND